MAVQLTLAQLLQSPTLEAWKTTIVNVAAGVGLKVENWIEGGFTRTLVALFSQLYATLGTAVQFITAGGFLDYAEGEWLTLLAKNVFNVERTQATYAAATNGITLTNTGGGLYIFEPGDLIVAYPDTGATYRNTSGGTLSPGPGQVLRLDLIAEEPGSGSNAAPGSITDLVSTNLGVTCTNEVALAGLDEESDEALRQRCRDAIAALSIGGIKQAYEFYAKSATRPDGSSVGVTRVHVLPATGDGTLTVYIAGASGAIPPDDVAIVQSIFDLHVTPHGLDATVASATNLPIASPASIWIPAALGLTEEEAQARVTSALQTYVQALPIGGVIIPPTTGRVYWRSLLAEAINAIDGTLKGQLASEVDIVVGDSEVPIWAGDPDDVAINQVS